MLITKAIRNKGRIKRCREIPDAFAAVISKCSAMFPKVIIEETRIASGSAKGTKLAEV